MKKSTLFKITGLVFILFIILGVMITPATASSDDKPPFVRMHVYNNSQFDFSIVIFGHRDYSLKVPPHSDKSIIVERGTYSFVMRACNNSASGTMNLNMFKNIYVPVCGGSAIYKRENPHNFDTSQYIKGINIQVKNKTHEKVSVYIRNTMKNYWVTLEPRGMQTLLVLRDQYVYSYVACGKLHAGYYNARVNQPLILTCKDK